MDDGERAAERMSEEQITRELLSLHGTDVDTWSEKISSIQRTRAKEYLRRRRVATNIAFNGAMPSI